MRLKLRKGEGWQELRLEQSGYCFGGKGGDAPDAPDYTPMANASKEAAQIAAASADNQLAENARQYDQNMAIAKPVINTQLGLMRQTKAQGDDYYNYGRSFRPAEQAMLADAFGVDADTLGNYNKLRTEATNAGRAKWQAGQDARRKGLSDQLSTLNTERQNYLSGLQPGRSTSQATEGLYEDQNGLIRTAGRFFKPKFDNGFESPRFAPGGINGGPASEEQAKYDAGYRWYTDPDGNEIWMRPQGGAGLNIARGGDPAADTVRLSNWNDREKLLRNQINDLNGDQFDSANVDYSEADKFQSAALMRGLAAQKERDQGLIDNQASLDASDRAEIDAYMHNQEGENAKHLAAIRAAQGRLQGLTEASNTNIYDQNQGDIEADVGRAVADSRNGYASSINQALRQGMRYGYSPSKLAAMAGSAAVGNASQQAAMANNARTIGINDTRQRLVAGAGIGLNSATNNRDTQQQDASYGLQRLTGNMGMRQQDFARNRGYTLQDNSIRSAKQMDAIGLGKGMPGFSQGAYSLANQSGNSAAQNQLAPSQA